MNIKAGYVNYTCQIYVAGASCFKNKMLFCDDKES